MNFHVGPSSRRPPKTLSRPPAPQILIPLRPPVGLPLSARSFSSDSPMMQGRSEELPPSSLHHHQSFRYTTFLESVTTTDLYVDLDLRSAFPHVLIDPLCSMVKSGTGSKTDVSPITRKFESKRDSFNASNKLNVDRHQRLRSQRPLLLSYGTVDFVKTFECALAY